VTNSTHNNRYENTGYWIGNKGDHLFYLLIFAHLILIWAFPYTPTQDGPSHLNNANVIKEYILQGNPLFREYFLLNTSDISNWIGHLLLAGLLSLFPTMVAEKIFLSGYIVMLPLCAKYAICSIKPEASAASFLIFPFIFNYNFHMGFYNFSYSLPLFFLLIGYWIRHSENFGLREAIVLTMLSMLLVLFHIMTFVLAYIFIGIMMFNEIYSQYRSIQTNRNIAWKDGLKLFFRKSSLVSVSFVPAILIVLLFLRNHGAQSTGWNLRLPILSPHVLMSFGLDEALIYTLMGLFMITAFVLIRSKWSSIFALDRYSLVLAVYALICMFVPEWMSGGSFMYPRMILFLYLALILSLASLNLTSKNKRSFVVVSLFASIMLLFSHAVTYHEMNTYLDEYMSAGKFVRNSSVLLPICFSKEGPPLNHKRLSYKVAPFLHASGYIAVEKDLIDLANYEAAKNFFPVRYRQNLNPYLYIGDPEALNRQIDFLTYFAENRWENRLCIALGTI